MQTDETAKHQNSWQNKALAQKNRNSRSEEKELNHSAFISDGNRSNCVHGFHSEKYEEKNRAQP